MTSISKSGKVPDVMAIITLLYPLLHSLFAIMTNAKHYVHYGYCIDYHNMNKSHNSNNIFLLISTHKSGIRGKTLSLTGGKHSYIHGPAIAAKIL